MITRAQLEDQTGGHGLMHRLPPFLYCQQCGSEASANAGDYWNLPDDHVFMCCGSPMRLVTKKTTYEDVV